jgi:eukaryotic-like serine/threonine-protein kinase
LQRLKRDTESQRDSAITKITAPINRKRNRWSAAAAALILIAALAGFYLYMTRPLPPARVSQYTQLTHDGHAGFVRGTDGSRVYLARGYSIGEVSISGGQIAPIPLAVSEPVLQDISPDGSAFLVASYKGGTTIAHSIWTAQILGGSLRYLASGANASWSPDGGSVAYSTRNGDLNLIGSDGSRAHKLASIGGIAYSIRWSPDGRTIRFAKDGTLWEISSSGSDLHPLFPAWKADLCCGQWSADGAQFYFIADDQLWVRDERRAFLRHSPAQPTQLTSGPIQWGDLAPSKDGKTLFVTGVVQHGELIRFDSQTKQFQPYLAGLSADGVAFSKDGQDIAYVSYPDDILWKAKADGSDRVQLSSAPLEPVLPTWSPDGTQILFLDGSSRDSYIVSSQGGSPRRLFPEGHGPQTDPNWSPDGRKIVFSNSRPGGADPNSDIRVLDLDTHRIMALPGSVGLFSPRWSPDGRSIAAVRMNSTVLNIFDIKTQHWSTPYKGLVSYLAWSKDSRSIYFWDFQGAPGVLRVRVSDGAAERIVDLKGLHFASNAGMWMGLDRTEAPLFLRDLGSQDVYALTVGQK